MFGLSELKRPESYESIQNLQNPLSFVFNSPNPNSVNIKLELSFAIPLRNFNPHENRGQILGEEVLSRAVACLLAAQTEQKNSSMKLDNMMEFSIENHSGPNSCQYQPFVPSVEFFSVGDAVRIRLSNKKNPPSFGGILRSYSNTPTTPGTPLSAPMSPSLSGTPILPSLSTAMSTNMSILSQPFQALSHLANASISQVLQSKQMDMNSAEMMKKQKAKQACAVCRTAKVSCDGKLPCKRCEQKQAECYYPAPKKRGRKKPAEGEIITPPSSQKKSRNENISMPPTPTIQPITAIPASPPVSLSPPNGSISTNGDGFSPVELEQLLVNDSSFFNMPLYDIKMLQDVLQEIPSEETITDARYKYSVPQVTPLRSLGAAILLYQKVFVPLVVNPASKEDAQKRLASLSELLKHYNLLDWKEYSDYTAHFLSSFVISNEIDTLKDPAFIWSTTGVLLFFNVAMLNLLGWKVEEMYNTDPKVRHGAFHVLNQEDMIKLLEKHFVALSDYHISDFSCSLRLLTKSGDEVRAKGFVQVKRNIMGIPILFSCTVYQQFFP